MDSSNAGSDPERYQQVLTAAFPMVADHPDVAGVLRDPDLLAMIGPALGAPFEAMGVTKVVAPEARGPILGALVAQHLGAGLVVIRKDDRNHPGADITVVSEPTWRGSTETFIARSFDLESRDVVLVVDDWITTGNSIAVARGIVESARAQYVGAAVLVNKADLETLERFHVHWLVAFTDLIGHR